MAYHRPEWIWYVAQLVVESRVDGLDEPILLIESILLRATSPEAAYQRAQNLGTSTEHVYRNKFGEPVSQRYLGIHDIDSLQTEQPDDELVIQVRVVSNSSNSEASGLVRSKHELSLFGGEKPEFSRLDQ